MKILSAIDFSRSSINAMQYALKLFSKTESKVDLINVYSEYGDPTGAIDLVALLKKTNEKKMNDLIAGLSSVDTTRQLPQGYVIKGNPIKEITSFSKEHLYDLLVTGAEGEGALAKRLIGSTAKGLANNGETPILIVPNQVEPPMCPKKIVLALDDKILENEEGFKVLNSILDSLDLKVDIIHITQSKKEDFPFDPFVSYYLKDRINKIDLLTAKDFLPELNHYISKNDIDLLAMIKRPRRFFSKMFFKSESSEEVLKTKVPFLILPG